MKFKSLGIAFAMAVGLFLYGYFLSTIGHDHSAHDDGNKRQATAEDVHDHGDGHH